MGNKVLLNTTISGSSLIGVIGKIPVSWGNYFWLESGHRVVNFWAENLEALGLTEVECEEYEYNGAKFAVITDKRIPEDYYYKGLCFTGGKWVSPEILQSMIDVMPYKDDKCLERVLKSF